MAGDLEKSSLSSEIEPTTNTIAQINDRFFNLFFSKLYFLIQFLSNKQIFSSKYFDKLDFSTIQFTKTNYVNEHFREFRGDIQFIVDQLTDFMPTKFHFIYEHQSTIDKFMSLRLLCYIINSLMEHRKNLKSEKIPLPFPIGIVLYNGTTKWDEIMPLSKLLSGGDKYPELWQFPLIFVNLSGINFDNIPNTSLKIILKSLYLSKSGINNENVNDIISLFKLIPDKDKFDPYFDQLIKFLLESSAQNNIEEIMKTVEDNYIDIFGNDQGEKRFVSIADVLAHRGAKQAQEQAQEQAKQAQEQAKQAQEQANKVIAEKDMIIKMLAETVKAQNERITILEEKILK
jgi:hypothetical protein